MEDEYKKNIIFIIAIAFCIVFSGNIYSSIKSYKYRRLCDKYRAELITATNENRELTDRIGKCQSITESIGELCNRNVTDAREIIETVEILRTQIQELENICYDSDSIDSYYNYWDNEFGISQ